MITAPPGWLAEPGTEPDAVIREARRRQRRRWLAAGVAIVTVVAGAAAVIAGSGAGSRPRQPGSHDMPAAPAHAIRPAPPPGLILAGAATTLVMWPVGYPLFTPTGGPPAYLDDLTSGRLLLRQIPGIAGGDYRPYLVSVGRWLVYNSGGSSPEIGGDGRTHGRTLGNGISAIPDDLKGQPRVLGRATEFVPSARPGHVWLWDWGTSPGHAGSVRSVSVSGGRPGPAIALPRGTAVVVEGTSAGLLLIARNGDLELWNPGAALTNLAYLGDGISDGFAADARLVAYGSGCQFRETARDAGSTGYDLCTMLRVLNVVTGRLVSFAAPPGTAGWAPAGFNTVSAISPGDGMIAAYAVERPQGNGRARLYVLHLAGPRGVVAVPSSAAFLFASTAWTAAGSWLLYRGPGGHLWAYQVTSGTVRASSIRHYGLVAVPNDPGGLAP